MASLSSRNKFFSTPLLLHHQFIDPGLNGALGALEAFAQLGNSAALPEQSQKFAVIGLTPGFISRFWQWFATGATPLLYLLICALFTVKIKTKWTELYLTKRIAFGPENRHRNPRTSAPRTKTNP